MIKSVHVGTILHQKETLCLSFKGKRQECLSELNDWLFDYCRANAKAITQLPPLDDWDRSVENPAWWTYVVPEISCSVSLRIEHINFP